MNIFERLDENELDMMSNYIEAYASYDCNDSLHLKAPLSHILRFWNKNKVDLYTVFGGEFILTKKVQFTKPTELLEEEMGQMIYGGDGGIFYRAYDNWCRSWTDDKRWVLHRLMYAANLATNIWDDERITLTTPDDHKIMIDPGCKITRVLGKIAKAFNIEGYEEFRIAHSQVLNQKKVSGDLCLSIHPLDYMTMSDNNSDWSSCMNWQDRGDYRQGTVEMMNSPYVVVAYLKSSADMYMPYGDKWNNKKWRQLYIVTPHIITGIRQYPYESEELNGAALNWLRELVTLNTEWGPFAETTSVVQNNRDNTFADIGKTVYLEFYTHFMYNDFYARHLSYVSATIPDRYALCFSGESECMECGADISHYDACDGCPASLTCNECEHVIWCADCGERINYDDSYEVDGMRVCEYCYENNFKECVLCEELHHENDTTPVYLRVEGEVQYSYYIWVCYNCINSNKFKELFGKTVEASINAWNTKTVVDLENFKSIESLDMFDIWRSDDYDAFAEFFNKDSDDESEPSNEG